MHVVSITGERRCEIVERPEPRVAGRFAKVKVLAAPMCTEVGNYCRGDQTDCLGHEAAGVVVEAGPQCKVPVGTRVIAMPLHGCGACDLCMAGDHILCPNGVDVHAANASPSGAATYAQFCLKADHLLLRIPDDIDTDHASMACCGLGPTFGAMKRMNVTATDTVLISGLGAVGLGGVVAASFFGARVIGLEPNAFRAELAKRLGCEHVVDPRDADAALHQVMEITGGAGVEKSIECSSQETAPALLVRAARRKGQITSVGWGGPVNARDLVAKGLSFHGQWHWNHQLHAGEMFRLIRGTREKLDQLITHRLPMGEVKDAWELQAAGRCGKIVLHPWG